MKITPFRCQITNLIKFIVFIAVLSSAHIHNAIAVEANARILLDKKLQQLTGNIKNKPFPIALLFDTEYRDGLGKTHLYLLSNIRYATFVNFFKQNTWCNALILQIHIKACRQYENKKLDIYLGTDNYAEPDDVFKFEYKIVKQTLEKDYLHIAMKADDGPMDSENYHIGVEIIPAKNGKSLVHFYLRARYGIFTRTAMGAYLLTSGSDKIGFTNVSKDPSDEPVYQRGVEGILERNAMRYVLAFFAYLESNPRGDSDNWFQTSLQRWHRYTEQFHKQLYEISLQDYVDLKKREYQNQLKLLSPTAQFPDEEWPGD